MYKTLILEELAQHKNTTESTHNNITSLISYLQKMRTFTWKRIYIQIEDEDVRDGWGELIEELSHHNGNIKEFKFRNLTFGRNQSVHQVSSSSPGTELLSYDVESEDDNSLNDRLLGESYECAPRRSA